jgi:hypothetical protein
MDSGDLLTSVIQKELQRHYPVFRTVVRGASGCQIEGQKLRLVHNLMVVERNMCQFPPAPPALVINDRPFEQGCSRSGAIRQAARL